MVDFSPFFFVFFVFVFVFLGGEGVKSNYHTNGLKLRLSFPKIVDDVVAKPILMLTIKLGFYCYHKNNRIAGFLCLIQKLLAT